MARSYRPHTPSLVYQLLFILTRGETAGRVIEWREPVPPISWLRMAKIK